MGRLSIPLVPEGPVRRFYERLHALHLAADRPSMRALQRATRTPRRPHGINSTSIHAAFTRPRLARWEVVREIVRLLDGDVAEFTELWQRARRFELSAESDLPVCPPQPAPDTGPPAAPALDGPPAAVARAGRPATEASPDGPLPRELPPDVTPFLGRDRQLARLDALLAPAAGTAGPTHGTAGPPVIALLTGAAGVGKTALAVHWAHRIAGRFPDGQLYADLNGWDSGPPVGPAEVLTGFLAALGDDPVRLPADLAGRAARYRTLLADRSVLILLDNAGSAEQVRPLLPGTGRCLVAVTSRDDLADLVARSGARRLPVAPLPAESARHLLRALCPRHADADPETVDELVRRCAGLPLALRLAAERLTAPVWQPGGVPGRLGCAPDVEDAYPADQLRASVGWSFRRLPAPAARLGWQFALHPGSCADTYALAALAGTDVATTVALIEALLRANLCVRVAPGRYALHLPARAYGRERSERPELAGPARAALRRLLDHYLTIGARASALLRLAECPEGSAWRIGSAGWPSGTVTWWAEDGGLGQTPVLSDRAGARAWLDVERSNLSAMVDRSRALGWEREADELAAVLAGAPTAS
ncbi:NB-ARC domain-containing protein [Plantactinospora sp. CA-290183]|uniref:NB-ARC domain-containing protein n=1 Tax=Plantactinospora sp. CA-290183 TaxID=3240006 RepID=UPI003D8A3882